MSKGKSREAGKSGFRRNILPAGYSGYSLCNRVADVAADFHATNHRELVPPGSG